MNLVFEDERLEIQVSDRRDDGVTGNVAHDLVVQNAVLHKGIDQVDSVIGVDRKRLHVAPTVALALGGIIMDALDGKRGEALSELNLHALRSLLRSFQLGCLAIENRDALDDGVDDRLAPHRASGAYTSTGIALSTPPRTL